MVIVAFSVKVLKAKSIKKLSKYSQRMITSYTYLNSKVAIELEKIKVVKNFFLKLHLNTKMYLKSKLYTPSTLNIDFIQWHTQLIVCAVK